MLSTTYRSTTYRCVKRTIDHSKGYCELVFEGVQEQDRVYRVWDTLQEHFHQSAMPQEWGTYNADWIEKHTDPDPSPSEP